ncbi:MAG: hypothetical protein Q4C87_12350 [Actinomycetaceae bacterium]|nr:hypothetical protein [Actinomycetaceae bacterium]
MSAPYNPGQQPAGGQPSAQQPQYMGQPQMMAASHPEGESLRSNSTIVLILSIVGIFIGWFCSIPAWIWGSSILKRAAELGLPEHYVSQAKIGKIIGIVMTILWGLGGLFYFFIVILAFAALNSGVAS